MASQYGDGECIGVMMHEAAMQNTLWWDAHTHTHTRSDTHTHVRLTSSRTFSDGFIILPAPKHPTCLSVCLCVYVCVI